jgi:hypothetical protein
LPNPIQLKVVQNFWNQYLYLHYIIYFILYFILVIMIFNYFNSLFNYIVKSIINNVLYKQKVYLNQFSSRYLIYFRLFILNHIILIKFPSHFLLKILFKYSNFNIKTLKITPYYFLLKKNHFILN